MSTKKRNNNQHGEDELEIVDLSFCFQLDVILEEVLSKLSYIGKYTESNSKGLMAKIIGQQIKQKLLMQRELEEDFEKLIKEKALKTELIDEDEINKKNQEINDCAEKLKESAYSIYKTLAENPDVPKNLLKAKTDQAKLLDDMTKIKSTLICGNFDNFNKIIDRIDRSRFDIEQLRREEMKLYRELKKLNEDYATEEKDFKNDRNEMERSLLLIKKSLADTKQEEKLFQEYQNNQIDALKKLYTNKFEGEEAKLSKEIDDLYRQRDNNAALNEKFRKHMRDMEQEFKRATDDFRALTKKKETEKEDENLKLKDEVTRQNEKINELKDKIKIYRAANERLEKDAVELKTVPYDIIHNPKLKAEREKKKKEEDDRLAKEAAEKAAAEAAENAGN